MQHMQVSPQMQHMQQMQMSPQMQQMQMTHQMQHAQSMPQYADMQRMQLQQQGIFNGQQSLASLTGHPQPMMASAQGGGALGLRRMSLSQSAAMLQKPQGADGDMPLMGTPLHDTAGLAAKLKKGWKPKERVSAIKLRIEDYARTHGLTIKELKAPVSISSVLAGKMDPRKNVSKEVQILNKVVQDGEDAGRAQESELLTLNNIKSGMRDFLDYAIDEVDRYAQIGTKGNDGAKAEFNWRSAGHYGDIPSLRRSMAINNIGDGADPAVFATDPDESEDAESVGTGGSQPGSRMQSRSSLPGTRGTERSSTKASMATRKSTKATSSSIDRPEDAFDCDFVEDWCSVSKPAKNKVRLENSQLVVQSRADVFFASQMPRDLSVYTKPRRGNFHPEKNVAAQQLELTSRRAEWAIPPPKDGLFISREPWVHARMKFGYL
eukprot:TRINITY_DN70652_c0_g1_i1.p1 TRINITY_DN70652_c0_g1~~TRINITY_DN70652_c0_g1_i1.p1  ORF type:complete len:435 (+),score=93.82 TRINITY_DN70652_c0_g1_i1:111-1415(+)